VKRVTLFCGHFGSGKTNIAVNYALARKAEGKAVAIADLDIVNPYFRSKDSEDELVKAGIDFISLPFANTNVDLPSIPSEAYSLVQNRERYAVLDIGGDDRGALALGRFVPAILEENDYENLFVVNFYRPLTENAADAAEIMKEIESASHLPFTGIVNNSNLGAETTAETVEKTEQEALALAELTSLPLVFTAVREGLTPAVRGDVFPLRLQKKSWE